VEQRDLTNVVNYLNKFNIKELFKIPSVWRYHLEYFDLIYNTPQTKDYRTAMEQDDEDVEEAVNIFREKLEEILSRAGLNSQLIDRVIQGILPEGDLEIIEGNPSISQDLQSQLTEQIERM